MAGVALDRQGMAKVGDVVLRAPGLAGNVEVTRGAGEARVRGATFPRGPLAEAQRRNEMTITHVVVIDRPRNVVGGGGARGPGATPADRMELQVPVPPAGHEQVVLSTDEHGIRTWHFGADDVSTGATRGGRRTRTYVIPRSTGTIPAPTTVDTTRGTIPGLAKIIEVITFPVASAVAAGVKFAVGQWDRDRHKPRIRIRGEAGVFRDLGDDDWTALSAGPALLLVHGTFSTTEGAFGALPDGTWAELRKRYGGRIIAFDHPTIANDPFDNASQFFELVRGRPLELDIVCHSRGGLVSRSIAERPDGVEGGSDQVKVKSIVFVGATNEGTILADADHWNELIDRLTTILSLVPLPGGSDVLESVLAFVRSIAIKTIDGLVGLVAMAPGGDFLPKINKGIAPPVDTKYYAIVSDFEPINPGLRAWLHDGVRDLIFRNVPNDMMVPISSTCGDDLETRFPIAEASRRPFSPARGIQHSDFFGQPETSEALLEWLTPTSALAGAR